MNIFEEAPKNWLDLQDKVAYILEHCGYSVEMPKLLQTSRGCVEVKLNKTQDARIADYTCFAGILKIFYIFCFLA